MTVYGKESKAYIHNDLNRVRLSSSDDNQLRTNADGSVDLYFGPTAPAALEGNWTETVPGKGFYPMFRFYTPKAGVFDGTWTLPDVEVVN